MTMQYKISPRENLASPGVKPHRTWEVVGFKERGGDTLSWGVITKFNTEEQARDYVRVQEGIKVEIKRSDRVKTNFHVLINGEHRATFLKRSYTTGYDFKGRDGSTIDSWAPRHTTQADFELIVRTAIAAGKVPTMGQIERWEVMEQAEEDHRAWKKAREDHRAQVRTEVLTVALENYLGQPFGSDEHKAMAERMLAGLKNGSGWL